MLWKVNTLLAIRCSPPPLPLENLLYSSLSSRGGDLLYSWGNVAIKEWKAHYIVSFPWEKSFSVGKKNFYIAIFSGVRRYIAIFRGDWGLARGKMHNITPVLTLFHVWSLYYETGEIIIVCYRLLTISML